MKGEKVPPAETALRGSSAGKISLILVVAEGDTADACALTKAAVLARHFEARIELFRCESELEYSLRHAYELSGADRARRDAINAAREYLNALRTQVGLGPESVNSVAVCETPLWEAVLRAVRGSHLDLVVKTASHGARRFAPDPNDWQLMRACPVPLLLTSARQWASPPRIAAAVNPSGDETPELTREILRTCGSVMQACDAKLDLLYCEPLDTPTAVSARNSAILFALADEFRISSDRVHLLTGDPNVVLPNFASAQGYDIVALGALTHRQSLVTNVGTLTGRLIDSVDCDFLLVKSHYEDARSS